MSSLQGLPVSPGVAVGRAVIIRFGGFPAYRRAIEAAEFDSEERRLRRDPPQIVMREDCQHSRRALGVSRVDGCDPAAWYARATSCDSS